MSRAFGWPAVVRLGLVQASIGAVVVLATSTLNRVMQVEYGLPALVPGLLVAAHHLVQLARPRMGYGSDQGARRTPWILGGMATMALGGCLAAAATASLGTHRVAALCSAVLAFLIIGVGVSAAGTSLLALLAKRVDPPRRAGAATTVWLMMILGFAITSGVVGRLLDPYSAARLVTVACGVGGVACAVTLLAVRGLEGEGTHAPAAPAVAPQAASTPGGGFARAVRSVWDEPAARLFTQFIFVSMLAYSAQELLLEPYAGSILGYTPGQSASLSGLQHAGVLLGMLAATLAGRGPHGGRFGSLQAWQVGGCVVSALMLCGLGCACWVGPGWPFRANVFALGVGNGAFCIAAIASMMRLASVDGQARVGLRMGLWGAAQAVAFGLGGLFGTACSDVARWWLASPGAAYTVVFALQATLFMVSAALAVQVGRTTALGRGRAASTQSAPPGRLATTSR